VTQPLEGILETALYAADLDAAEAFYGGVLGLEKVTRQANRHLFYRCGPGILLIFNPAETAKPVPAGALPVPSHGATGPGHVCFRVRGEQIEGIVERLQAAGVPVESDFFWPNGARSIYFRDPAGNSLECAEPRLWNLK
jgi:catechol 2,3-dioxygenase-like lactoylglutathione lyase family enzyme